MASQDKEPWVMIVVLIFMNRVEDKTVKTVLHGKVEKYHSP